MFCINSDIIYLYIYIYFVALLYLVKKPQLSRRITRWMLLFLEYNFSMVYKPMHFHLVVDVLLQLLDAIKNPGVHDKTIDASLFIFQLEWIQEVHTYISTKNCPEGYSTKQWKKLVLKALCHHRWKVVYAKARSNFASMFALWWDFSNPMRDAWRSWWQTFLNGHHNSKGVKYKYWWPILHKDAQQHYQSYDVVNKLEIFYIPQWQS